LSGEDVCFAQLPFGRRQDTSEWHNSWTLRGSEKANLSCGLLWQKLVLGVSQDFESEGFFAVPDGEHDAVRAVSKDSSCSIRGLRHPADVWDV
jgi:hypothetical protein